VSVALQAEGQQQATPVLKNVTFNAQAGTLHMLVGPNGCGKVRVGGVRGEGGWGQVGEARSDERVRAPARARSLEGTEMGELLLSM